MAITEFMSGVQVEITVDGQALTEYEDGELTEEDRTVTRYVEAVSGQDFAIGIKLLPQFKFKGDAIAFEVYADGNWVACPLFTTFGSRSRVVEGHKQGGNLRKFRFTDLQTISDGSAGELEPSKVKKLGTIEIRCDHSRTAGKSSAKGGTPSGLASNVSRKALKGQAISQAVGFGETVKAKRDSFTKASPLLGEPRPGASFVFRYRSLAGLKSEGIVPRTPSPEPIERRDAQSLTRADIEALQKNLRDLKDRDAAAVSFKREKQSKDRGARKKPRLSQSATQNDPNDEEVIREVSPSAIAKKEIEIIELD